MWWKITNVCAGPYKIHSFCDYQLIIARASEVTPLFDGRTGTSNFQVHTVHLDIIKVFSPTLVICLKNSFKIFIQIDIKTAPTCFGAVTPSSGSALLVLVKVTVVKIVN